MIYFITIAFNAEKTLRRAVESVLSQTYGDFTYHLCDNGSQDGTGNIVREYARLDKRVVPFFNEKNSEWKDESLKKVWHLPRNLQNLDWHCVLDADDDYEPIFLENMLGFAEKFDLDYVACRSNFIDEATDALQNEYVLERDIFIEAEAFGTLFPDYFRFMGAKWGKLQKGSMFNCVAFSAMDDYLDNLRLSHRDDTAIMFWYLRYSKRAGVLAQLLHNYRLHPVGTSQSTHNIEQKIQDNYKMPEVYRDFLRAKVGHVSIENEKFIQEAFERSMRRTLAEKGKRNLADFQKEDEIMRKSRYLPQK
jgi:glycosyltransferase involved in cell wall biosynthesis